MSSQTISKMASKPAIRPKYCLLLVKSGPFARELTKQPRQRNVHVQEPEPQTWVRCPTQLVADVPGPSGAGTAPTVCTAPPTSGSGDVTAGLQQGAAEYQSRLPMRNGPVTISSVTAVGLTLRMEGTIAADLSESDWNQLDPTMRGNLCSGSFAAPIRRGATAETILTDIGGERRSITVSTC